MKRRGGVGLDMSSLRPHGSPINNAAKVSDGITCFMERYSNTTKEVAQNGRRGALMLTLDCRHPDLENFITIKQDLTKVTGANISVKWHDDFLKAVENNEEYTLRFPIDSSIEDAKYTKVVNAKEIWNKFVKANWASAEPGCLFWDRVTSHSLSDCYPNEQTISTNPCGEITLSPYTSCILMAINLTSFVDNPYTNEASFNHQKFNEVCIKASRLIDDMIDIELEKVDIIIDAIINGDSSDIDKSEEVKVWHKFKEKYNNARRVGLGILGYGDMIAMLNKKYGGEDTFELTDQIFNRFHNNLLEGQTILAKERGAFKIFDFELEKNCSLYDEVDKNIIADIQKYGRRNISFSTIAPTGTISCLAQVTSGIEPVFMRSYNRRRKLNADEVARGIKPDHIDGEDIKWIVYEVFHHGVDRWKKVNPDTPIEQSPYWGSEASEIPGASRTIIQSIAQKYITHSISSTCNMHKDSTVEDVNEIYMKAWKSGCKGITIYRDGCRDGILAAVTEKRETAEVVDRPKILQCDIHYSTINGNPWILFVGILDGKPYEIIGGKKSNVVIPQKYKSGWIKKNGLVNGRRAYDLILGSLEDVDEQMVIKDIGNVFSVDASSYTRHISLSLRYNVPINVICETLHKDGDSDMFSFAKGMARVLKKYIGDGTSSNETCPECGEGLKYKDGCISCIQCGWSKCQ
jgi:ribonucleoside-diphosphate reductase alpha chain